MPPTKTDPAPDVPNDPGVTEPADPADVQPADEQAASGLTDNPAVVGGLDGPLLAEAAEPEPTEDELRQLAELLPKAEAAAGRVSEQHPDYPRDEFTGEPLPPETIGTDEWGRSMAPGVQR